MADTGIFALAAVHADWLSARQSALAGNIANANVPGYKATDTVSFERYLDAASRTFGPAVQASLTNNMDPFVETDRSVAVERELFRAAEVRTAHGLNTAVASSFQSLFLAAARSQ